MMKTMKLMPLIRTTASPDNVRDTSFWKYIQGKYGIGRFTGKAFRLIIRRGLEIQTEAARERPCVKLTEVRNHSNYINNYQYIFNPAAEIVKPVFTQIIYKKIVPFCLQNEKFRIKLIQDKMSQINGKFIRKKDYDESLIKSKSTHPKEYLKEPLNDPEEYRHKYSFSDITNFHTPVNPAKSSAAVYQAKVKPYTAGRYSGVLHGGTRGTVQSNFTELKNQKHIISEVLPVKETLQTETTSELLCRVHRVTRGSGTILKDDTSRGYLKDIDSKKTPQMSGVNRKGLNLNLFRRKTIGQKQGEIFLNISPDNDLGVHYGPGNEKFQAEKEKEVFRQAKFMPGIGRNVHYRLKDAAQEDFININRSRTIFKYSNLNEKEKIIYLLPKSESNQQVKVKDSPDITSSLPPDVLIGEKDVYAKAVTVPKTDKGQTELEAEEINLLAERVFKILEKRLAIQKDRRGLK